MKILIVLSLLLSPSVYADFDSEDLKLLVAASELKDSDALMVWKDGTLLYSMNRDVERKYSVQSVTKTLNAMTATCVLRDFPGQMDRPLIFKEWEGTPKADITLRMLLTMTSGIIDPADSWGNYDYYDYAAKLPLTHAPGTTFSYANTSPMIIGKWIKENTGHQFTHHIQRCMFDVMGIKNWTIGHDGQGNDVVAGGVKIKADDLLKVGIMLAQGGVYEGQELYSKEEIQLFRRDVLPDQNGYGLSFWLWGRNIYYAEGYMGQFLIIIPDQKLVILRLRSLDQNYSNWFTELPGLLFQLIK